ncbi:MAG: Fic family protein [Bifidobacteriaceae bacterium]|nr:Fic family protein [Bifidobacteriaceae bacterium]
MTETSIAAARVRCMEGAKQDLIDLLWRSANIEVAVTFPQTADIFKGVAPDGVRGKTVRVVNNLKHAWQFLFDNVDWPVDWAYLSEYNRLVGEGIEQEPGRMRTVPVGISGTDWIPDTPVYGSIEEQIDMCNAIEDPIERAVNLFGAVCRGQWFSNGNKRTAVMAANHSLIHDGVGVLALPAELMGKEFRDVLLDYYESNDIAHLSQWLRAKAIRQM